MRVQEIIRHMIDIVDQMQSQHPIQKDIEVIVAHPMAVVEPPVDASPFTNTGDINRFKQIVDLADKPCGPIGNSPNEKYADIDAVTVNAGGGMNGPKNPSDLRGEHPSLFPAHQHGVQ